MNPFAPPHTLSRLQIEVTTGCNLKCQGCQRTLGMAAGTWRNRHMAAEIFARVIANCPPADVIVLQGIGEPTLHPELPTLVRLARDSRRFAVISFNTNALVRDTGYYAGLMRDGLGHVSVSVDALAQPVADNTRAGTDCRLLADNLVALGRLGLGLTVSVVLSRTNLDHLPDLLDRLAVMTPGLVEIQPLIDYGGGDMVLDAAGLERARAVIAAARQRHPGLSIAAAASLTPNGGKCRRPLRAGYVTVDGLLTPCCTTDDVELFGRAGVIDQGFADAWHSPGVARWFNGYLDGEPEICRGCSFNPSGSFGRDDLARALSEAERLHRDGRLDEAERRIRAALDGRQVAEALHRLGMLDHQRGRDATALALTEAALALDADRRYRNNRAMVLNALGRRDEALSELEAVIAEAPDYPLASLNAAAILEAGGERERAAGILLRLAERAAAAGHRAYTETATDRLLAQGVALPGMLPLAHRLRLAGDHGRALALVELLLAHNPGSLALLLARCAALLPVIYDGPDQMAQVRRDYAKALHRFVAAVDAADAATLAAAAHQVGQAKPFFLGYQGEDDRELQSLYGRAVSRIMQARHPLPPPHPAGGPRLRVGFVSRNFSLHSVSKLFGGWIKAIDRERFDVHAYVLGELDAYGAAIVEGCTVRRRGDTADCAAAIAADRLDALIYPELGMEGTAIQLAALRLAPVQCVAWGHPVTSGLPTVDYMLSSELMEPPDGDAHYTETLVRLPALSIRYEPLPDAGLTMTRAQAGLRDDAVVLVCCQSLFKYRPADDHILMEIAAALPEAQFLFIGDAASRVGALFRQRLQAAGLSLERHVAMVPPVAPKLFPALLRLGDVYLDSLEWSGGNTTLEAVPLGLPVVTLAGRFMRGRHSAAILTRMGLGDLVATSRTDYVAAAVRLGRDPAWRRAVSERVLAGAPRLYDDDAPVRALEDLLTKAVAEVETRLNPSTGLTHNRGALGGGLRDG